MTCNLKQLQSLLGPTSKTWQSWILDDGCPGEKNLETGKWEVDSQAATKWYLKREIEKAMASAPQPQEGELDPAHEQARLARAKADDQEMKNAERRGDLLDRQATEEAWIGVAMAIRAGVMALGSRLAPELVGLKTVRQIKKRIDDETHIVLSDLSNERPG